jgi:hypothetical protein
MGIIAIIVIGLLVNSLFRPYQRPQVVVVQRDSDSEGSSTTILLVIFLIGLMLFTNENFSKILSNIFLKFTEIEISSPKDDKDTSTHPKKYSVVNSFAPTDQTLSYLDKIQESPTIQPVSAPIQEVSISEPTLEVMSIRPVQPPLWAVILKKYADEEQAYRLQEHFRVRNIQIVKMTNGEFWSVIIVEDKKQGKQEVEDWKRHWRDWANMNLSLEIRDLNNN